MPAIQPEVEKLYVIQRTPPWIFPHSNRPIRGWERRIYRRFPAAQRLMRGGVYAMRESAVLGFVKQPRIMNLVEKVARAHQRRQIDDPELLEKVTPDYTIGCKRILPSNKWYPALGQPNVELITGGVEEVREGSFVDSAGNEHEVDTIIFSTGFQVTDMPVATAARGRGGKSLDDIWKGSPRAHFGCTVPGFPNFFLLLGPNTGLGHSSMVYMIESQVNYVLDALRTMRDRGAETIEVARGGGRAASTRSSTSSSTAPCGTPAARAGTSTTPAATPRSGPTGRSGSASARRASTPRTTRSRPSRTRARGGGRMSKRVIITGAASGIGAATASGAARARRARGGPRRERPGRRASSRATCATRSRSTARWREAIEQLGGGVDVLINNAGIGEAQSAGEAPDETALAVIDINMIGPWRVTSAALPALRESRGRVVNVASGLAFLTVPFTTAYCMSKRGRDRVLRRAPARARRRHHASRRSTPATSRRRSTRRRRRTASRSTAWCPRSRSRPP